MFFGTNLRLKLNTCGPLMCLHATLAESFPATTMKRTKVACIWLTCFPSLEKKTCCESSTVDTHWWAFNPPPELPKLEAGEMPHINHLSKFFVSHKVEARNNHQTRTAKLPEPKELAGWTARHSRTFKNLCNFWEISKSILSNPSLILSSWAHSPGPSCSFTSASSFW